MDTMIRTFFRHILESFKSLRRNGWMTISSISAVTITLALLGVFLMIILNTVKLAEDMENNVEVSVFMNHGVTQEEQDELEATLKALPHVESVEFSSQDEELERVKESYGDVWGLFDQDNPLLNVFIVRATEPQYVKDITKAAQSSEYSKVVHKATYGEDLSDSPYQSAINLKWLINAYKNNAKQPFWTMNGKKLWIDQLSGTDDLRKQIEARLSESEIKATWQKDLESFKKIRVKYLIYKD